MSKKKKMAYNTFKRTLAVLLTLILSVLLLSCEAEPEDTSIWATEQLPYDYPLESYVVLGKYDGIEDVSVELDYDLTARRNSIIAESFEEVSFTKVDTVERGDKVVLECEVLLDGEVCDILPAGTYEIYVGALTRLNVLSDAYVECLLVNAMQRSINKEFDFTVPSFYSDIRYRGRTLTVKSRLLEIYRPSFDAITDELVMAKGSYESVDALYDAVEIEIYKSDAEVIEYAKKRILWDKAVSDATFFNLPKDELQRCEDEYIDYFEEIAEYNGVTYEKYLETAGTTHDNVLSEAKSYAETKVKNELLAFAIAKKEGLIPTQTKCQMLGHELAHTLGYSGYDELISYNTEQSVYVYIIWDTAANFIVKNAKAPVTE